MDELERIGRFLADAWAGRAASCGGVVHRFDGLAVCLTGVPLGALNPTLVRSVPSDPDRALADAESAYEGTGLRIGVDAEVAMHAPVIEAAGRAGLVRLEARPGMSVRVADVPAVPAPDGVELFRVEDPALLDEVAEADQSAFGGDVALTRRFLPDALLDDPAQRVYAARVDGRIVATGESSTIDGVMGVFGIATRPEFRRRGIATALTSLLIRDRAGEADVAYLDASELGFRVYERLGFRVTSTWEIWIRKPA